MGFKVGDKVVYKGAKGYSYGAPGMPLGIHEVIEVGEDAEGQYVSFACHTYGCGIYSWALILASELTDLERALYGL